MEIPSRATAAAKMMMYTAVMALFYALVDGFDLSGANRAAPNHRRDGREKREGKNVPGPM